MGIFQIHKKLDEASSNAETGKLGKAHEILVSHISGMRDVRLEINNMVEQLSRLDSGLAAAARQLKAQIDLGNEGKPQRGISLKLRDLMQEAGGIRIRLLDLSEKFKRDET